MGKIGFIFLTFIEFVLIFIEFSFILDKLNPQIGLLSFLQKDRFHEIPKKKIPTITEEIINLIQENNLKTVLNDKRLYTLLQNYYNFSDNDGFKDALNLFIYDHSYVEKATLHYIPNHFFVRNQEKKPLTGPINIITNLPHNFSFITKIQNFATKLTFPQSHMSCSPSQVKFYFFLKKKLIKSTNLYDISESFFNISFEKSVPYDKLIVEVFQVQDPLTKYICLIPNGFDVFGLTKLKP